MLRRTGILLTLVALTWTAAVCGVPERGSLLPGIDEDSMRVRLAESDLQPLEGIWYYPNEQLTLGIERWRGDDNIQYRIILLDCDDAETLPGMIMGYIAPTAVPTKYQMWLFSERDRLTLLKPLTCVATLSSSGTSLTFDPPHWRVKVRVNFARFLPNLFRAISIIPEKVEERVPVGFNKIYPEGGDGNPFMRIRYL